MSENEEKDRHKVATEPTVIVVNQQSDHRMSYPADLPEDLSKRAKIPSIPSTVATAADFKEVGSAQHIERNKQDSSERTKQTTVPASLSKQQASAMLSADARLPEMAKPLEDIDLATMESEPVLKVIPSEPIPLEVKPTRSRGSLRSRRSAGDESGEEDVLPAREATRISDWETDYANKKKQISWSDPEYLEVQIQESSSVGPLAGRGRPRPRAKPCGIAWRLPRRSMTDFATTAKTGINIVISKGSLIESKRHLTVPPMHDEDEMLPTTQSHEQMPPHCTTLLREKLDMMCSKIKHYFK